MSFYFVDGLENEYIITANPFLLIILPHLPVWEIFTQAQKRKEKINIIRKKTVGNSGYDQKLRVISSHEPGKYQKMQIEKLLETNKLKRFVNLKAVEGLNLCV